MEGGTYTERVIRLRTQVMSSPQAGHNDDVVDVNDIPVNMDFSTQSKR